MSERTDDLARQARERHAAEERARGSVQGNSDAAEIPRALKHEQERKSGEQAARSEGGEGGGGDDTAGDTARTVDTVEETRETTVETETVVDSGPGADAPSPTPAPVESTQAAPEQLTEDLANAKLASDK